MKKLLLLFFALLQSVCIFADTVEIDGIYYNLIEKGNIAEVTKSPQGYSGDIVIQESISYSNNKYSVIGIGDNAFKSSSITSIYIPSSIKEIKEGAFGLCEDLTAVKISNLESWCYITFGEGSNPLAYAKHLFVNGQEVTDLDIPEGITELKTSVFANFSSLKSVTIPSSVVTIGGGAFSGCINLKTISIPNSVTSIGDGTFRDCISLKKISIPNSVTNIGSSAFENCKGLESVSLPNGLKKIKTYSFQNCTTLKTIKIPSSVESIWPCAFKDCKNLESVELSESLTEMESEAFSGCSKLSSLIIPDKLTGISRNVFYGCESLKTITLGKSISGIGYGNFTNCTKLENVYCYADEIPYADDDVFQGSYIEATTLHVPDFLIEQYKKAKIWSNFGKIIALENGSGEKPKCEKPIINYSSGKLAFTCTTEGVEFISEIKDADIGNHYDATISLKATYNISVYATKSGYQNSETVTATLCWIDAEPKTEGITNGVANVRANPVLIQSNGNVLNISGVDAGMPICVFDVTGKQAGSATATSTSTYINTNLTKGQIAIVKIGEKSVKIIMR